MASPVLSHDPIKHGEKSRLYSVCVGSHTLLYEYISGLQEIHQQFDSIAVKQAVRHNNTTPLTEIREVV